MTDEQRENISEDELDGVEAEALPDREAMSLIGGAELGGGITLPVEPPDSL